MDTALIVILSGITLGLALLAVIILLGKGDAFIAGYNTSREEHRKQFNIRRLRVVVAALLLLTVAFVWLVALIDDILVNFLVGLPVLFACYIFGIILANTWCKKK